MKVTPIGTQDLEYSGFSSHKLGDGTNYAEIEDDGDLTFIGDSTVWDDLRIVPGIFSFAGSGDPAQASWQPGGSGATFTVYEFDNDDEAFFTVQIPHSYKEGSDLEVHVHWTPGDRGSAESGNTVAWKMDYSWANIGGTFASSSTADMTDTCTGTDDYHEMSPNVTLSGSGKGISSMLVCRIYRDTGDTWSTNTVGNCPILLEVDLHFEKDTVGSRTTSSK